MSTITKAHEALELMRAQGISPRERRQMKVLGALRWIYRWGWSTPSVIDGLAGVARKGLCASLERQHLVRVSRTGSAGTDFGSPTRIVHLTPNGRAMVEREFDDEAQFLPSFSYSAWQQLAHDTIAQIVVSHFLCRTMIFYDYKTPLEIAAASKPGIKQPDAILIEQDDSRDAVEIELTAKRGRDFDRHILGLALGVSKGAFQSVITVSDSPAILRRYAAAAMPGTKVTQWKKAGVRYVASGQATLPDLGQANWQYIALDEFKQKQKSKSSPDDEDVW